MSPLQTYNQSQSNKQSVHGGQGEGGLGSLCREEEEVMHIRVTVTVLISRGGIVEGVKCIARVRSSLHLSCWTDVHGDRLGRMLASKERAWRQPWEEAIERPWETTRGIRHQGQAEPSGSFTPEKKVNPRHSNGSDYYREFLINAALNKIWIYEYMCGNLWIYVIQSFYTVPFIYSIYLFHFWTAR